MSNRLENAVTKRKKMYDLKLANRAEWAVLGFRSISGHVHDDDRVLMLAELDMRKAERMLLLALNKKTPNDVINNLAGRNMSKIPEKVDIAAFTTAMVGSAQIKRLESLLETVDHAVKHFRSLEIAYHTIEDYYEGIRATSKAVAYATVAASFFRYAQALYDWSEELTPTKKADKVEPWGDSPTLGELANGSVFDE